MRCKMEQSLSREGVSHTLEEAVKAVCSDVDLSQPGALDKKKKMSKKDRDAERERKRAAGVEKKSSSVLGGWSSQAAKAWFQTQGSSGSGSGSAFPGDKGGGGRGAKRPAPHVTIIEDSDNEVRGKKCRTAGMEEADTPTALDTQPVSKKAKVAKAGKVKAWGRFRTSKTPKAQAPKASQAPRNGRVVKSS
mmetsp:Transcript_8453/g.18572  ORF Transcript_8453/g.18572 Transcript_8453/m.18572 type:complete len:191 (-) Transcript_8453:94-666(-)